MVWALGAFLSIGCGGGSAVHLTADGSALDGAEPQDAGRGSDARADASGGSDATLPRDAAADSAPADATVGEDTGSGDTGALDAGADSSAFDSGGVEAAAATFAVGGTVSGLALGAGVTLTNDGGDDLTVGSNGSFTFSSTVPSGTAYSVTVVTQPTGQTCTVSGGAGVVGSADVGSVVVNCAADSFTVGGTVAGLAGSLVLQDDGGDDLTLTAVGSFAFPTPLATGAAYAVTVLTQPVAQTCTVAMGTGVVPGANVTSVAVSCVSTQLGLGSSCSAAAQCMSGNCEGNVCCAVPCTDQGAPSCGTNGACNVAGTACADYPLGTTCATAGCTDGPSSSFVTIAGTCSGGGSCSGSEVSCGNYRCAGASCKTACTTGSDCVPGLQCNAGVCGSALSNGSACVAGTECASGNCEGAICCAAACTDQGSTSCGTNGSCNATGTACADYASGTTCAPGACVDGATSSSETAASTCSGAGACTASAPASCGNYKCGGPTCKTSCTASTDCAGSATCISGVCKTSTGAVDGAACTSGAQCESGSCASNGICCAYKCTDEVSACGEDGKCLADGSSCEITATGATCVPASCTNYPSTPSMETTGGTCGFVAGIFQCAGSATSSCGVYRCGATACKTSCAADTDCLSSYTCNASHVCVPPACTRTLTATGAVQTLKIALDGNYLLTVDGAQGGPEGSSLGASTGGLGAEVVGSFNFTGGPTLNVVVGERPAAASANDSGGGGGGSFVYIGAVTARDPLIVAGGGGGGAGNGATLGLPFSTQGAGNNMGQGGLGGTKAASAGTCSALVHVLYPGSGGTSFDGNGGTGNAVVLSGTPSAGGADFAGGAGATDGTGHTGSAGGFGGGGGAGIDAQGYGGGGGGFSGGNAGPACSDVPGPYRSYGGTSFVDVTQGLYVQGTASTNSGNGKVTVYGPYPGVCSSPP